MNNFQGNYNGSNVSVSPSEVLDYQIQKQIKSLYKEFLFLVEKICNDHDQFLDKLRMTLPEQYKIYVDLAEFLTDSKYEEIRKEILDRGNQSVRNVQEEIKKYDISFGR